MAQSDRNRHRANESEQAWFNTLSYILGFAGIAVIMTTAALVFIAFGDIWSGFGDNKGEVPAWAMNKAFEHEVVDGIHTATGLAVGAGFSAVKSNCTNCHSAKLVTQNRASREGWKETIKWMQETQGLWDLGKSENIILDYLATYYGPEDYGRRMNLQLDSVEWYILDVN